MSPALLPEIVEAQSLDLRQASPPSSTDLEMISSSKSQYLDNFETWEIQAGGNIELALTLAHPTTIKFGLNLCTTALASPPSVTFSIRVNDNLLVSHYYETRLDFHQLSLIIDHEMLKIGQNKICIQVEKGADASLLIRELNICEADILPKRTIHFDSPALQKHANLSAPAIENCWYRTDIKAWSLDQNNASLEFQINLSSPKTLKISASLRSEFSSGTLNCAFRILVNDHTLVQKYAEKDPHFHHKGWIIPKDLLEKGLNTIKLEMLPEVNTNLLIRSFSVEEATTLPTQTLWFNTPKPEPTSHFKLLLQQGATYNPHLQYWYIKESGGYLRLLLNIPVSVDIHFSLTHSAQTSKSHSEYPFSIAVNNGILLRAYDENTRGFRTDEWIIPQSMLKAGDNELMIKLPPKAARMLIKSISVEES